MTQAYPCTYGQKLPVQLCMSKIEDIRNKTPEEVFIEKKPEISHLRIFGCPIFIHVPKEKREQS